MTSEPNIMTEEEVIAENKNSGSSRSVLGDKLQGKYLTFHLADEEYAVQILKVQEIITMQKVTAFPKAPSYVRGVINLRGKVIPVIDLRKRLGMDPIADTEKTVIIVFYVDEAGETNTIGASVDAVEEVTDMPSESIEEAPSMGDNNDHFIMGIGKNGDVINMLLNIDKVLGGGA